MKISIASLIYKSPVYGEFLLNSVQNNTPEELVEELFFIGNNPTEEVKTWLKKKKVKHYIWETEQQPAYPQNIGYIYKAWNMAIDKATSDLIVLINSDMWVGPHWLENLLKRLDKNKIVSSLLVESGKIPSLLPHTVVKNFGRKSSEWNMQKFESFAELLKEDTEQPYGAYMPFLTYKENLIKAKGYPPGNLQLPTGQILSGDHILFYNLDQLGIKHITSFDSIVYHVQGGEVDE